MKKGFFLLKEHNVFFIFMILRYYGTKLNNQWKRLLDDCLWDASSATLHQVECILSIQDRIYIDKETNRWKILAKKKHGGHLRIEYFKQKLLQIL